MNETWPMVPFEGHCGIIQASSGHVLTLSDFDGRNFSVIFEQIEEGLKGRFNQFMKNSVFD